MELIGSGVDIVDNRRIHRVYVKYSHGFAKKILHKIELNELFKQRDESLYLSSHFAVKEAISKAFGTGMRGEMSWRNIYITYDELGKPCAHFEGRLASQLDADNLVLSVSISHEKHYTIAYAIVFKKS